MQGNKPTLYKLKQPLLDWKKGETFSFDPNWNEWTRFGTGETYNYRTNIREGEKAMLLNYAKDNLSSIIEKVEL